MKLNGSINNVGLSLLRPKLTKDTEKDVFLDHPKKYQWHDRPLRLSAYNIICNKEPQHYTTLTQFTIVNKSKQPY